MKPSFAPHYVGLGAFIVLMVILAGLVGGPLGALVETAVKLLDPIGMIWAIAAGILCRKPLHLYIALIAFALALSVAVAAIPPGFPVKIFVVNTIETVAAILLVGTLANMIALSVGRSKAPK